MTVRLYYYMYSGMCVYKNDYNYDGQSIQRETVVNIQVHFI